MRINEYLDKSKIGEKVFKKPILWKKPKIRIYIDDSISATTAKFLNTLKGFNILYAYEKKEYRGKSHLSHYEKAKSEGRILLTMEKSFWDDENFSLKESYGIIIVEETDTKAVNSAISSFFAHFDSPDARVKIRDYFKQLKVRVSTNNILLKFKTFDGKTEYRSIKP